MKSRSAWPSKTHHQKASRTGVYPQKKDIQPAPQCAYIQMRLSLPLAYATSLQEMYPDKTLYGAVRQFLLDHIPPVDVKEI